MIKLCSKTFSFHHAICQYHAVGLYEKRTTQVHALRRFDRLACLGRRREMRHAGPLAFCVDCGRDELRGEASWNRAFPSRRHGFAPLVHMHCARNFSFSRSVFAGLSFGAFNVIYFGGVNKHRCCWSSASVNSCLHRRGFPINLEACVPFFNVVSEHLEVLQITFACVRGGSSKTFQKRSVSSAAAVAADVPSGDCAISMIRPSWPKRSAT